MTREELTEVLRVGAVWTQSEAWNEDMKADAATLWAAADLIDANPGVSLDELVERL